MIGRDAASPERFAATACWSLGAALAGLGNSVFHPADFSILNARVGSERLGHAFSAHGVAGSLGYASAPIFSGGDRRA